jgi:hypothetical protein
MPDTTQLAQYVSQSEKQDMNYGPPEPPKPGELIICQMCGRPMYPQDFSKDPAIRRREFKWHVHYACEQQVMNQLDRESGILTDRKANGLYLGNSEGAINKWAENVGSQIQQQKREK